MRIPTREAIERLQKYLPKGGESQSVRGVGHQARMTKRFVTEVVTWMAFCSANNRRLYWEYS